jgi:hypothetical protein
METRAFKDALRQYAARHHVEPITAFSILGVAVMLLAGCLRAATSEQAHPRPVFAHYMVCAPAAGSEATINDFRKEIQAAQAAGIDGFALNCGDWTNREPYYKQRSQLIYQAAKDLGTGFKLFVSADFATGLTTAEVRDMVETFRDHPNQFRHDGKPVLSTFGGGTNITEFVDREFTGGREICYVPFYYPQPAVENPGREPLEQIARLNPSLDGYFSFGAAGMPEDIVASCVAAAEIWRGRGKIYMHPVTPFYRGLKGNYRVYESDGFAGMARQWENAIRTGADWVEIVTWNDWGEASYVAPFGAPAATNLWNGHWGPMLSHAGFLAASRHYIDWFKTGRQPSITRDQLFYFYRLHPKEVPGYPHVIGKPGFPANVATLQDRVFVTAFLRESGTLAVQSGTHQEHFQLPPGVSHVAVPFQLGTPRFTLTRGARTVIDKAGEWAITTNGWSNLNYFSGSASAPDTHEHR